MNLVYNVGDVLHDGRLYVLVLKKEFLNSNENNPLNYWNSRKEFIRN